MQVNLSREELLSLLSDYANQLDAECDSQRRASAIYDNSKLLVLASRILILTKYLFEPPTASSIPGPSTDEKPVGPSTPWEAVLGRIEGHN